MQNAIRMHIDRIRQNNSLRFSFSVLPAPHNSTTTFHLLRLNKENRNTKYSGRSNENLFRPYYHSSSYVLGVNCPPPIPNIPGVSEVRASVLSVNANCFWFGVARWEATQGWCIAIPQPATQKHTNYHCQWNYTNKYKDQRLYLGARRQ